MLFTEGAIHGPHHSKHTPMHRMRTGVLASESHHRLNLSGDEMYCMMTALARAPQNARHNAAASHFLVRSPFRIFPDLGF